MKHKRKLLSTVFALSISLGAVHAQKAVLVAGGDASGNGGSSSFSIGQLNYITTEGTDGSVAQGVQQAYEISVALGVEEDWINLEVSAFPNPTADYLTLRVEDISGKNLSYQLYDMNGKVLDASSIKDTQSTINMIDYVPAGYFLRILNNEKEVKTFKIIKH